MAELDVESEIYERLYGLPHRERHNGGPADRPIVIVDGGVRRGTDIFKALALGASAVGMGRPYAWGLAAFGQPGVEAVLEILRRELKTIMRQAGTIFVDKISRNYLATRSL